MSARGLTPRERAIRLSGIKARADQAADEARALEIEWMATDLAGTFLDADIPAARWRGWAASARAKGDRTTVRMCSAIADAMDAQVREEAALSARFPRAVA